MAKAKNTNNMDDTNAVVAPVEDSTVVTPDMPVVSVGDTVYVFTREMELATNACPNCDGSGKSAEVDVCSNCGGKGTV